LTSLIKNDHPLLYILIISIIISINISIIISIIIIIIIIIIMAITSHARPRSGSLTLHDVGNGNSHISGGTPSLPMDKEGGDGAAGSKKSTLRRFKSGTVHQWKVLRAHPRIAWIAFVVFLVLCGVGLGIVYAVRRSHIVQFEEQGLELAQETGDFFCK
jgi:hypothetical protein